MELSGMSQYKYVKPKPAGGDVAGDILPLDLDPHGGVDCDLGDLSTHGGTTPLLQALWAPKSYFKFAAGLPPFVPSMERAVRVWIICPTKTW